MERTLSIHRHMSTLAIAIASVSILLTLVPASKAQIVYHKLDIVINEGSYNLDLDGVTYFTLTSETNTDSCGADGQGSVSETPTAGNGVIVGPLMAGTEIGSGQSFVGGHEILVGYSRYTMFGRHCLYVIWGGTWCSPGVSGCDAVSAYLGLSFERNSETYYGWAELSIPEDSVAVTLLGVAYQTMPGVAIQAGQTE